MNDRFFVRNWQIAEHPAKARAMCHTIVMLRPPQTLPAIRLKQAVYRPEMTEIVQDGQVARRSEVVREILGRGLLDGTETYENKS